LALGSVLQRRLDGRRASLLSAMAFTEIIEALKARRPGAVLGAAMKRPQALALLRIPAIDRMKRMLAPPAAPANVNDADSGPRIALLTRQRVVGPTNGSSSYLLSIVGALRDAGYAIDYIGASPKIFGRWPFLKMMPELDVFDRYGINGGLRLGKYVIARDPRVGFVAALGVAERLLSKLKLPTPGWSKPAAYSIAAKPTRSDVLFVARNVSPHTRAVLCDYSFLAPLAPYALRPEAPVLTVMHDLMSSRVSDDPMEKAPDEVMNLTAAEEFRMLGMSDAILAIQAAEAAKVKAALPKTGVILVPHFVEAVKAPQPGSNDTLLFVGSNTQPNVVGLKWFFEACWPLIRAARPEARLDVAGSVARSIDSAPEGVRLLGVVPDLAPLYRDAGVVISPLRTGSGLKIKLIEALAAGKSLVGTSVTAQGVERIVANAMIIEDNGEALATHVIALLGDADRRAKMGASALQCIDNHFSRTACFGELIARLDVSARIPTAQFAHG
jgi:succinoglycan biosynthesis protein ExoO